MTQFNLADELRRGGNGLLAQAVASIWTMRFRDKPYGALNEQEYAQAWLYARQQEAAAVPAGNQAKAPTALDEMRALQEAAKCRNCGGSPGATELCLYCAHFRLAMQRDEFRRQLEGAEVEWAKTSAQLTESREALARAEAERDTSFSEQESVITRTTERLEAAEAERDELKRKLEEAGEILGAARRTVSRVSHEALGKHGELVAARAELRKRDAVIEAARNTTAYLHPHGEEYRKLRDALAALDQAASGPECAQKGHAYATNKGECCIYCFRPKAECLHMGEPASEAEVTERAIVVGSVWEHAYHRMRATVFQLTDHDNSVHFQWEDGERRVWPDWQLRAHFTWVSNPEATESATKEAP